MVCRFHFRTPLIRRARRGAVRGSLGSGSGPGPGPNLNPLLPLLRALRGREVRLLVRGTELSGRVVVPDAVPGADRRLAVPGAGLLLLSGPDGRVRAVPPGRIASVAF